MKKVRQLFVAGLAIAVLPAFSAAAFAATSVAAHPSSVTDRNDSSTTEEQSLRAAEAGKEAKFGTGSKSRQLAQKSRSAKSRMIARAKAIRKKRLAKEKRKSQV